MDSRIVTQWSNSPWRIYQYLPLTSNAIEVVFGRLLKLVVARILLAQNSLSLFSTKSFKFSFWDLSWNSGATIKNSQFRWSHKTQLRIFPVKKNMLDSLKSKFLSPVSLCLNLSVGCLSNFLQWFRIRLSRITKLLRFTYLRPFVGVSPYILLGRCLKILTSKQSTEPSRVHWLLGMFFYFCANWYKQD